jgi:hypothetical protein
MRRTMTKLQKRNPFVIRFALAVVLLGWSSASAADPFLELEVDPDNFLYRVHLTASPDGVTYDHRAFRQILGMTTPHGAVVIFRDDTAFVLSHNALGEPRTEWTPGYYSSDFLPESDLRSLLPREKLTSEWYPLVDLIKEAHEHLDWSQCRELQIQFAVCGPSSSDCLLAESEWIEITSRLNDQIDRRREEIRKSWEKLTTYHDRQVTDGDWHVEIRVQEGIDYALASRLVLALRNRDLLIPEPARSHEDRLLEVRADDIRTIDRSYRDPLSRSRMLKDLQDLYEVWVVTDENECRLVILKVIGNAVEFRGVIRCASN